MWGAVSLTHTHRERWLENYLLGQDLKSASDRTVVYGNCQHLSEGAMSDYLSRIGAWLPRVGDIHSEDHLLSNIQVELSKKHSD